MAVQKVRVPQADGEIRFTENGDEVTTHVVTDHLVSPRTVAERDRLLQRIDGARLATARDAGEKPPPEKNPDDGNTVTDDSTKG